MLWVRKDRSRGDVLVSATQQRLWVCCLTVDSCAYRARFILSAIQWDDRLPVGVGQEVNMVSPECHKTAEGLSLKTWQSGWDTINWFSFIKSCTTIWQSLLRKSVLHVSPNTCRKFNTSCDSSQLWKSLRFSTPFPNGIVYKLLQLRPTHYWHFQSWLERVGVYSLPSARCPLSCLWAITKF